MALFEALFVGSVLVGMLSLLFVGWKTPEIVVFLALVLVWNAGTISTEDALSGFSNPGVLAVGSLFVVIKGVERSRLADRAAKHVFGLRTSLTAGLLRLMGLAFLLSAFLNNTPVVALLIPITKDWAKTRGFSPSLLLMPLSYSCIFGGLITIIGTSTNLVVQGLVMEATQSDSTIHGLGFFEPGYIGLPLGIVGMLYLAVAAPRVLARVGIDGGSSSGSSSGGGRGHHGGDGRHGERAEELLTEVQVSRDFKDLGKPIALVLARLGLPAESLIRVTQGLSDTPTTAATTSSRGERFDNDSSLFGTMTGCDSRKPSHRKHLGKRWDSKVGDALPLSSAFAGGDATVAVHDGNVDSLPLRRRIGGTKDVVVAVAPATADAYTASPSPPPCLPHVEISRNNTSPRPLHPISGAPQGEDDGIDGTSCLSPLKEPLRDGDVLVLRCSQPTMISFQGSVLGEGIRGLEILGSTTAQLQSVVETGTKKAAFFEVVLSDDNQFVGRSPAQREPSMLVSRYGCLALAVRHAPTAVALALDRTRRAEKEERSIGEGRGSTASERNTTVLVEESRAGPCRQGTEYVDIPLPSREQQEESYSRSSAADALKKDHDSTDAAPARASETLVRESTAVVGQSVRGAGAAVARTLAPGDVVLVVAKEGFSKTWKDEPDFDLVTWVGSVPKAVATYDYLSLLVFCAMLGWVLFSSVTMVRAAFAASGVLMVGGWVDPRKSVGYVDWSLLLLVGSALGLSKAIANSGLAGYAGNAIKESGMSASASLYLLYGFTMICTELITNNAAAALAVPIALSIAKELEVSYKPFALTVMIAASSSFMTPIGYQTNTMVWAPGGYEFSDFVKLGTPLSLIYLGCSSFLMPLVFPF